MKRIEIQNLKQIKHLEFEIPKPGVHVLSGTNGSGKSSVLACLLRIGRPNAFQLSFKTSKISPLLDEFKETKISYTNGDQTVSYHHSGSRWEPTPKKNGQLLKEFGYPGVVYAAADSQRIEPRAEDFKPQRVRDAPTTIKRAACKILDNIKFNDLKVINVRRGVGAEAFLLPAPSNQSSSKRNSYYSEKNFSLGELCVLKLLRQLEKCPNGALVLIDELELALHPRAQIRLFEHLQEMSKDKGLTTIFSTHSVNLIKTAQRQCIHFIERIGDTTTLHAGCFPTFVLGQISFQEENSPDIVVFVEDERAQGIVDEFVRHVIIEKYANKPRPSVVVVPIGTIQSVISMLSRASALLPPRVAYFGLLDQDAKTEYISSLEKSKNHKQLEKIREVEKKLAFLPWTPEVGMCQHFYNSLQQRERDLQNYFGDQRITLSNINTEEFSSTTGAPQRDVSKRHIDAICRQISDIRNISPEIAKRDLSRFFVVNSINSNHGNTMKATLLPMLQVN